MENKKSVWFEFDFGFVSVPLSHSSLESSEIMAETLGLRVKKVRRRISWEEFDERWWKGLCVFCGEQETTDHHLQHKNSWIMMINCDEEQLPVIYHETDLGTLTIEECPKVEIHENLVHKEILEEESCPQEQVPILNLEHGLRFHKASLDVCKDSHSVLGLDDLEVDVLEAIGKLNVSKESQPLTRTKLNNDDGASLKETIDVNGFQVLPSQAESVKRIFERYPDMALEFQAKNQPLRTSCINVLLNLIETLCLSLQDLSIDDLGQAEQALTYLKYSGFKVDWLDHKLEEVKQKKIEEQISKTRMQELEALLEKEKEELKELKQKCSDTKALLEKEKTKVLAASRASPLTLDDVV